MGDRGRHARDLRRDGAAGRVLPARGLPAVHPGDVRRHRRERSLQRCAGPHLDRRAPGLAGGDLRQPVRLRHRPQGGAGDLQQAGLPPVQAGVRRAHRRLLRQARGQGHHPGPVRPDRAHLHPRHGRSRQDALQPLPRVQRPGRDLLGLRHHLARLLPGQYHLDPEEHRPHDPRDRLRLGHPDAHRGPAQALRRRHAEPRQQAGGEAGPTTARVRSGAGRERSEAAPAPDAHQRPLRQHVVRIQ